MAYGNSAHKLPRLHSYEAAHKYFEGRPKPPRSRNWQEHQRPLKDTRSTHYRIEKGEGYYDLVHYSTTLARYWAPDAEGNEHRQYRGYPTNTSRDFLAYTAGVGEFNIRTSSDGRLIVMPVCTHRMGHSAFSLDAWFTPSNNLIVEKSRHTALFKKVSSDDDKAARKAAKRLFDPLLTIAALRIPEFAANVDFNHRIAGPFQSIQFMGVYPRYVRAVHAALRDGIEPDAECLGYFMKLAEATFDKIASDRASDKGLLSWHTQPSSYDEIEPIDERTFINALWRRVRECLHLKTQNGRQEYPQFPDRDTFVFSNVTT